MRSKQY